MKVCMVGAFERNAPFGTEIAFAKGLREVGVNVSTFDPSRWGVTELRCAIDGADAVIIFKTAGDWNQALRNEASVNCRFIVYQPDDVRAPGIRGMLQDMRQFCHYAFTFDSSGAAVCKDELGYLESEMLMVTADPACYHPIGVKRDIQLSFVGSMSNPVMHASRRRMIDVLRGAGFEVVTFDGMFDITRINEIYNRSMVVLNHATDVGQAFGSGYGYQCRHFEVAATGGVLLTNKLLDAATYPSRPRTIVFDDEDTLVETARIMLRDSYSSLVLEPMRKIVLEEFMEFHSPRVRGQQIVRFLESIQ